METKNRGVILVEKRPTDYIFGSNQVTQTAVPMEIRKTYLSENELQINNLTDFMNCVTFGGKHCLEMWMNFLLPSASSEFLNFLNDNGYIKNGKVKFSARFSAILNGTNVNGNDQITVSDHFRNDGLLGDAMLPIEDNIDFDSYYNKLKVTDAMKAIAQKLKWFITIQNQIVNKENFDQALRIAPISVATAICAGWDTGNVVNKCTDRPVQHDTMIWNKEPASGVYDDFDDYPPFNQQLSADYDFPYNMQYVVTLKPMTLRKTMRGDNVEMLQRKLNGLGETLIPDGKFGQLTEDAVKRFQKEYGLIPDGICGPKTAQRIQVVMTITIVALFNKIEVPLAIEVCRAESEFDPNCINKNTDIHKSTDRGLYQWNDYYHKEISDSAAFDPGASAQLFCDAVKNGKLHDYWSASEPNWKKKVDPSILKKYGIIS